MDQANAGMTGTNSLHVGGAGSYHCTMQDANVTASLQYLVYTGERPVYIASRPGADAALEISAEFEPHEVVVHDARKLAPPASLDREGFTLREHHTAVDDFYHPAFDREQYEAEITALAVAATGASRVHVFDHTLRSDSPTVRGERATREPASVIHNDYTDRSARKRVFDLLGGEAESLAAGRFAIVNAWRSVRGTVRRSPLALCDASTLAPGDLVASERRAADRVGELELVSWNPAHRWYYYPAMTTAETLLLKTFDSADDGRATRTIHTAFDSSDAAPDAPPRESIESRMLLFF